MLSPSNNLVTRLSDAAHQRGWGARVALRQGDRAWTFEQVFDQAARIATVLKGVGVTRGDRVAVLMRDTLDAAGAILGIFHAGAVAVPLSELARAGDIRAFLEHSGATVAMVDETLAPVLDEVRGETPGLREILCVGGAIGGGKDLAALLATATAATAAAVEASEACMVLYSAASSRLSMRAVPHAHATAMVAWESYGRDFLKVTDQDRVLSVARLATAYGLGAALLLPLAAGAESLLFPDQPHSDAVFAAVDGFKPTLLFATPSVLGQMARDAKQLGRDKPLAGLRLAISGAEAMPDKLVPRIRNVLGTEVAIGYGLTEVFQFVLGGITGSTWEERPGSCGRPLPGVEARVVDDDGKPIGADEIGTLQVRAPSLFAAYWGTEDLPTPFTADGWFTTRDRFLVDAAGFFYHCGRVDDLFKVGGKWVSPDEVERTLSAHEAVWECAVIGADDEDGLIKPLAFVVVNVGHQPSVELAIELRDYVRNALAPYKYPRWIEFVEQLPRGPGGKILRYKLRPSGRRRRAETAAEP